MEQQIHSALRVLMEDRTTLIVAHRLSTISLADRVVLLDGGRIVADGTHAELLASTPLYSEVLAQAAEDRGGRRRGRSTASATTATLETGRCSDVRRRRGGGPMGGGGPPGAAQPGLPFGGIPSELQAGVDLLLAEEPDRGESDDHVLPSALGRREAPAQPERPAQGVPQHAGRWPACWSAIIAVATQLGPWLTEIAINDGMLPGHHDFGLVVVIAVVYLVSVASPPPRSGARSGSPGGWPPGS